MRDRAKGRVETEEREGGGGGGGFPFGFGGLEQPSESAVEYFALEVHVVADEDERQVAFSAHKPAADHAGAQRDCLVGTFCVRLAVAHLKCMAGQARARDG